MTPRRIALSIAAAFAFSLTLQAAALAQPQEPPKKMELVGFSDNGREYALKVEDAQRGFMFEVRDSKKNEVEARYPFDESTEDRVWRKVKRKHEMTVEPSGPENKKKDVTLMTTQKGDKLIIYVMRGEAIKKYDEIQLLVPEKNKDNPPAESTVLNLSWGPRGKYAVVVYHQKLKDMFEWEGDFAHSFKFRSYRVKFPDEE